MSTAAIEDEGDEPGGSGGGGGLLTRVRGELQVVGAEERAQRHVLEGSGRRRTREVVGPAAAALAALDGGSKALTVRTELRATGGDNVSHLLWTKTRQLGSCL